MIESKNMTLKELEKFISEAKKAGVSEDSVLHIDISCMDTETEVTTPLGAVKYSVTRTSKSESITGLAFRAELDYDLMQVLTRGE